nr:MAG TPA: hypothetical protein [Caudoviricetes sp.]
MPPRHPSRRPTSWATSRTGSTRRPSPPPPPPPHRQRQRRTRSDRLQPRRLPLPRPGPPRRHRPAGPGPDRRGLQADGRGLPPPVLGLYGRRLLPRRHLTRLALVAGGGVGGLRRGR